MNLEKILKKIAAVLNREKVPYALIGGVAVSYYAVPRATYDIDAVISVKNPGQLAELIEKLKKEGFSPEKKLKKISGFSFLTVKAGAVLIDLFLAEKEFLNSVLKRKKRVKLLGRIFYFVSPEDLIVLKLLSGRGRDIDDVREILKRKKIDMDYLTKCCGKFGVEIFLEDEIKSLGSGSKNDAGGKK